MDKLEKGLWRTGKEDYRTFVNLKLSRKTNLVGILFGILLTAVIILPLAILLVQIAVLYACEKNTPILVLSLAWGLLLLCNGLSSYINVKIIKAYEKDMNEVQNVNDVAIFYYQTLNIGFAIGAFLFLVLIFFFISSLG